MKIFIVDDSLPARVVLKNRLAEIPDIEVVGEAETSEGGILGMDELRPDVVLLEASVEGALSYIDAAAAMKNIYPEVKIILCTDPNARDVVVDTMNSVWDDFIEKPYKTTVLKRVLKDVNKKR